MKCYEITPTHMVLEGPSGHRVVVRRDEVPSTVLEAATDSILEGSELTTVNRDRLVKLVFVARVAAGLSVEEAQAMGLDEMINSVLIDNT